MPPFLEAFLLHSFKVIQCCCYSSFGSNGSFTSERAARKWGAQQIDKVDLKMNTLGEHEVNETSTIHGIKLQTTKGKTITILDYSLWKLTGAINRPLDANIFESLLPKVDTNKLLKKTVPIDLVIGNDILGLHPRHQVGQAGPHLYAYSGPFGQCAQEAQPAFSNFFTLPSSSFHVQATMMHKKVEEVEFSQSIHNDTLNSCDLDLSTVSLPAYSINNPDASPSQFTRSFSKLSGKRQSKRGSSSSNNSTCGKVSSGSVYYLEQRPDGYDVNMNTSVE